MKVWGAGSWRSRLVDFPIIAVPASFLLSGMPGGVVDRPPDRALAVNSSSRKPRESHPRGAVSGLLHDDQRGAGISLSAGLGPEVGYRGERPYALGRQPIGGDAVFPRQSSSDGLRPATR